jgi:hypothetical protein
MEKEEEEEEEEEEEMDWEKEVAAVPPLRDHPTRKRKLVREPEVLHDAKEAIDRLLRTTGRRKVVEVLSQGGEGVPRRLEAAVAKWGQREARREAKRISVLCGMPRWLLKKSSLAIYVTFVLMEDGEWEASGVAAESAGLRRLGINGQYGYYMAFRHRVRGVPHTLGRLGGHLLGEGERGSTELRTLLAGAGGDHCYMRSSGGKRVRVYDGSTGTAGGVKTANDARGIVGAENRALLDSDGVLSLMAKREVDPLEPTRGSYGALLRSEIFFDYGEDYWSARQGRKAGGLSLRA